MPPGPPPGGSDSEEEDDDIQMPPDFIPPLPPGICSHFSFEPSLNYNRSTTTQRSASTWIYAFLSSYGRWVWRTTTSSLLATRRPATTTTPVPDRCFPASSQFCPSSSWLPIYASQYATASRSSESSSRRNPSSTLWVPQLPAQLPSKCNPTTTSVQRTTITCIRPNVPSDLIWSTKTSSTPVNSTSPPTTTTIFREWISRYRRSFERGYGVGCTRATRL